jgi:hypothetical protein
MKDEQILRAAFNRGFHAVKYYGRVILEGGLDLSKRTIEEASDKQKIARLEKALIHAAVQFDKIAGYAHGNIERAKENGRIPSPSWERTMNSAKTEAAYLRDIVATIDRKEILVAQSALDDHVCLICGEPMCFLTPEEHP